jgi:O-acetylserine/cysteine efflux transporter
MVLESEYCTATGEYGYMNTNRRHAVAALIAAGLLWGTTVPLTKLALEWLTPGWLTAVRFGLAAAVLLAVARRRGHGRAQQPAQRSALRQAFTPAVLAAGALGYGGSVMVQNAGITRTSVTHAALLIGAVPVLVAIIAAVWHRTVARPVAWFGFALSLGGVGLVTAGGGGGGATMAGDGLVLVSLLLSAAVTVAQARLLTGRDPVAVTAVQFLGAALGSLPVAALTEGAPAAPASAGVVLAVVALALAGTLVPFTLFAFGQSRVSAEVAGAFLNLEPLVGAVAGVVAFGDPAGLAQIAGGMAILAGIALSSLPLLAGRRMARRATAAVTASAEAGARTGRAGAGVGAGTRTGRALASSAGRVDARIATTRAGAEARFSKGDSVPNRFGRAPHSLSAGAGHRGRNGVFVVVRGGKFGAGRPGGTRPGVARPERTRPGGRAAGRPPARGRGPGRGTDGPPPGGSGRRPGESGRRPGEPTQRPGRQRTGRRGTGRQRTGRRGPDGPRRTLGGFRSGLPQVRA